jgi:nuclease S1
MSDRRTSPIATAAMLTLLFAPGLLWPWGRVGHRASALLAESRLTPAAAAEIRRLFEPGETLADVSTWADQQREVPGTGPWHYVNVPITASRFAARFCQPEGCVVSKIEEFRQVLLDPKATRTEKQRALRFLVHFLQDLHQPVHVGDNGDRGGNLLQLRFFDLGTNLHRLLDSQIIDRYSQDEAQWVQELNALATPAKSAQWSRGSLGDWATESLEEAKLLYREPGSENLMGSGTKLGEEYYRFALPIIRMQLARAGIRLALTLNIPTHPDSSA